MGFWSQKHVRNKKAKFRERKWTSAATGWP